MRTVHKYRLDMDKFEQKIEMPMGARILSVQNQLEHLTFWASVNPSERTVSRTFYVIGTGNDAPEDDDRSYIMYRGTAQFMGGVLVLHVFERIGRYLNEHPVRKHEL